MVPNAQKNPPQLLKMTSSAAFRRAQAWLLEKPTAWADDPCLAAAQMAQRPPAKRPREDSLLEAKRSHQRRRIELLDKQLDGALVEVRRLACELENTEHSQEVLEEVREICTALRTPATRAQRAELALRWFESDITWYGRWENWKVGDDKGRSPRTLSVICEI